MNKIRIYALTTIILISLTACADAGSDTLSGNSDTASAVAIQHDLSDNNSTASADIAPHTLSGNSDTASASAMESMSATEHPSHPASGNSISDNVGMIILPINPDTAVSSTLSDNSSDIGSQKTDKSRTADIVMVGDILLHTRLDDAARSENGSYDFSFIFDDMKSEIEAADLALVNQEVIIGGEDLGVSGYPSFNAPYEIADALEEAGFDVICHATNHALDKGKKGIINTLSYWQDNYPEIEITGIYDDPDAHNNITITEINGIKIAILNYTYGTNGISIPSDMPYAVNLLKEDKVISDLENAEKTADFTIVCPHWGTEYNTGTDSYQKKWTEIFRTHGADLVLGTHPHVIEPIEMLEDDTDGLGNNHGNGDMLVYYSLGNFVNWTSGVGNKVSDRMVGGMAKINIGEDESGEISISDYSIEALVCHLSEEPEGVHIYPLSEYTEEMASQNAILKQAPSFSLKYCTDLCDSVWDLDWD